MIGMKEGRLHSRVTFIEEVERLSEAADDDHVDDAESPHVTQYHAVDHRDEGSGQTYCPAKNRHPDYYGDVASFIFLLQCRWTR